MSNKQRWPLGYFNQSCAKLLCRPWTEAEFAEFRRNDELDVIYQVCLFWLFGSKDELFNQFADTKTDLTPVGDKGSTVNNPVRFFHGWSMDLLDYNLPRGYRVIRITHIDTRIETADGYKDGLKAFLPYVSIEKDETLATYITRVGDEGLVKIGVKKEVSDALFKTQLSAIKFFWDGSSASHP
uniref:Uncharacterized protein n=1 Tax=Gibberella zeae TaxID=5518 RepID=A0A4E9DN07_GIBZA